MAHQPRHLTDSVSHSTFERFKSANSIKNGGRGVYANSNRKNMSTLSFQYAKISTPMNQNVVRPSKKGMGFKNAESTGDIDMDRRPMCRYYVKQSTINLALKMGHNEEPYYMKNVHAKPKWKNLESHGPTTNPNPLSAREMPRPRNNSRGQLNDLMKFKKSVPGNFDSSVKIGTSNLFREGNSMNRS